MIQQKEPYILVFGMSICDIFGFTNQSYRPYDSNPGVIKMSYGGVCRNIAENMARVGVNTKFISILGDDERGKSLQEHAKKMHFDMSDSLIVEGAATPTYIAILDEKGEMVSAVVDISIASLFTEEFVESKRELIKNAEFVILDADNPAITEYIVKNFSEYTNIILDPVSAARACTVKHLLPYIHTLKPNRYEAEVLCGFELNSEEAIREAGNYFRGLGIKKVFISLDCEGIYYHDGVEEGIIKAQEAKVINVTGAGDAFVAGIGYSYMNAKTIKDTVKFANTMSLLTIAHEETIDPTICEVKVQQEMTTREWIEKTY
ncbi:carbohydrate kinase family protein [Niameybacter massiliensis]|uniref:Carbohydrate kinase family protein n=1 Tax=Holtiella tumoricola TaxID=3018743 RepID=A0AA42DL96_9FIRM|nr:MULTISPECIES: carbohydrate kinase family protein [Lachnospirales]MDA3731122.1 carbohydrate kinase family protein [Holtiella tumoricola]